MNSKIIIRESKNKNKRFEAEIIEPSGKNKIIYFGAKNGSTYIDHKDQKKKENYIKRHAALNEDWRNPFTAGALSRYILWEKPNLSEAVKNYENIFKIKVQLEK
jgi:hypothetical protein